MYIYVWMSCRKMPQRRMPCISRALVTGKRKKLVGNCEFCSKMTIYSVNLDIICIVKQNYHLSQYNLNHFILSIIEKKTRIV